MPYTDAEKKQALQIARRSILHGLEHGQPLNVDLSDCPDRLHELRASFVTLHKQDQLRGCIGAIEASLPLARDIALHAWSAAFRDRRFMPLARHEFDALEISISVLGQPEPIAWSGYQDLLEQIVPGEDGLILEEGGQRGLFLPSVWSSLPEKEEFLRHLEMKAGLPVGHWNPHRRLFRFRTISFAERQLAESE